MKYRNMNTSIKPLRKSLLVFMLTIAMSALATGAILAVPQQTYAYGTICKTITLKAPWYQRQVWPYAITPVCYDGSNIWQNGNITAGVDTIGWSHGPITWYGSYNSGGSTIGVGLNYDASLTVFKTLISNSCATRWILDANANVISYTRGC